MGFEPTVQLPVHDVSNVAPSATRTLLLNGKSDGGGRGTRTPKRFPAPVFETGALPLDYPSASQIRLKLGRPLAPKKLLHQLAAFISQNAAFYYHPMVEQWTGAELKY